MRGCLLRLLGMNVGVVQHTSSSSQHVAALRAGSRALGEAARALTHLQLARLYQPQLSLRDALEVMCPQLVVVSNGLSPQHGLRCVQWPQCCAACQGRGRGGGVAARHE